MEKTERHTYGDHFVTTETGINVLQLQAKNSRRWIRQGRTLQEALQRAHGTADI